MRKITHTFIPKISLLVTLQVFLCVYSRDFNSLDIAREI